MDEDYSRWHYRSLLAILLLLALILCLRLAHLYVSDVNRFPINTVKIAANFKRIPRNQLEAVLSNYQNDSYFALSEKKLQNELLALDWADDVRVTRVWPDTLSIKLVEKEPMAIWNQSLITADGRLFNAEPTQEGFKLPELKGPETQKNDVLQIYKKLSKLLETFDLHVALLQLHDNQSLDLFLTNGVQLRLGKRDTEKRLERFCKAYHTLFATTAEQLASVDLRYERGMAVQWRQQTGR